MSSDGWFHNLSFVLRFNNHFTGDAVADELPVRLANSLIRPVLRNDGAGRRQPDGTYRFVNLSGGTHLVRWLPPWARSFRGWISWEDILKVTVPNVMPASVIERDLWPTSSATPDPAMTAIRGKLQGTNVAGQEVRIFAPASPRNNFTRTDQFGNFLFPLPHPIPTDNLGMLDLQIQVEGGTRPVNGGQFHPAEAGETFPAADFKVAPGRCHRIIFQIT
jgi:hypothetical protein